MRNVHKKDPSIYFAYIALIFCIMTIILFFITLVYMYKNNQISTFVVFSENPALEKAVQEKKEFYNAIIFLEFIMLATSICIRLPKRPRMANKNLDGLVSPILAEAIIDGKVRIKRIYYDINN